MKELYLFKKNANLFYRDFKMSMPRKSGLKLKIFLKIHMFIEH